MEIHFYSSYAGGASYGGALIHGTSLLEQRQAIVTHRNTDKSCFETHFIFSGKTRAVREMSRVPEDDVYFPNCVEVEDLVKNVHCLCLWCEVFYLCE